MIALRKVQEVTSRSLTIQLPDDFQAKRVEIIVLPMEMVEDLPETMEAGDSELVKLQNLLLTAPTLSDAECENFAQVRHWMTEWHAEEF